MDNREIAERIFNDLVKRGAELGNVSIGIIHKTLDNLKLEHSDDDLRTAIELAREGNIGYIAPETPTFEFDHTVDDVIKMVIEGKQ